MDPELQGQVNAAAQQPQVPANLVTPPAEEPRVAPGTPHPGEMLTDDQIAAREAAQATQTAATPAATPEGTPPETPTDADGQVAQPVTPGATPPANSARAIAAAMGIAEAANFQDDQTFMAAVMEQANQAAVAQQQLAAVQQHLQVQQWQQAQALLAQQQQAQQAQQPPAQPAKLWNPPDYNPAWEGLVRKDETGNYAVVPGAPADILPRYLAYHQYRREFADKLLNNPEATLAPMIEAQAEAKARQLIDERLAANEERTYVQRFVQENTAWLHARDQGGNVVRNPVTQEPVLSVAGRRFQGHLQAAEQMGVRGAPQQERYARAMLTAEYAQAQLAQQQPRTPATQTPAGANRRPNMAGTLPQRGAPQGPVPGSSLQQQLALAFAENGITDAEVNATLS